MSLFVAFTVFGLVLSWVDIRERRLPNTLIAWLLIILILLTSISNNPNQTLSGLKVAGMYSITFTFLYLISRGKLGFGDVKFAIPCGFVIGIVTPENWLLCVWLMFVLAGLFGLARVLFFRDTFSKEIPFGPFMTMSVFMFGFNSLYFG